MIPIKLRFTDNTELNVFVHDPSEFRNAVLGLASAIESIEDIDLPVPEKITECDMTLYDGSQILCSVASEDVGEVREKCPAILSCEESYIRRRIPLKIKETMLDDRIRSVYRVLTNIPNQGTQHRIHQEYLKRKESYAASMEALVDGLYRKG